MKGVLSAKIVRFLVLYLLLLSSCHGDRMQHDAQIGSQSSISETLPQDPQLLMQKAAQLKAPFHFNLQAPLKDPGAIDPELFRPASAIDSWNDLVQRFVARQNLLYREYNDENGSGIDQTLPAIVLVGNTYQGLGNKMMSLASATMLAILSGRCFRIVDNRLVVGQLSTVLNFKWPIQTANNLPLDEVFDKQQLVLDTTAWDVDRQMRWLMCSDASKVRVRHILYNNWNYAIPVLASNPAWRQWFDARMPKGLFSKLIHLVAEPADVVLSKVNKHETHLRRGDAKLLGLQIRRHGGTQYLSDEGEEQLTHCARMLAEELQNGNPLQRVSILLATDFPAALARVQKGLEPFPVHCLGARGNNGGGDLASSVQLHDPQQHKVDDAEGANAAVIDAFVDMLLLSRSDDLVTTSFSTFGYVAAALKQSPAASVVHTDYLPYRSGPSCVRTLGSEPQCLWCAERAIAHSAGEACTGAVHQRAMQELNKQMASFLPPDLASLRLEKKASFLLVPLFSFLSSASASLPLVFAVQGAGIIIVFVLTCRWSRRRRAAGRRLLT